MLLVHGKESRCHGLDLFDESGSTAVFEGLRSENETLVLHNLTSLVCFSLSIQHLMLVAGQQHLLNSRSIRPHAPDHTKSFSQHETNVSKMLSNPDLVPAAQLFPNRKSSQVICVLLYQTIARLPSKRRKDLREHTRNPNNNLPNDIVQTRKCYTFLDRLS